MTLVVVSALALMLPGAVLMTLSRQKLVEIEYAQFPEDWVRDGKPVGGSSSRKKASFWSSGFATWRVQENWLTVTPAWVQRSPEASAALRRFRLGVTLLMIGIVTTVGVATWAS